MNTTYTNLHQLLEHSFKHYDEQTAFHCLDQSLSFSDIEQHSRHLARWFEHRLGLKAGDRLVIQLPNLAQYPVVAYAALRLGLIVVNTNPLYTPREMLHQFNDAGAKAIVILSDLKPKLDAVLNETGIEHVVVTGAADLLQGQSPAIEGATGLMNAIAEGQSLAEFTPSDAGREDIAVLQYTGGTTGVSKGAMLTHANLLSNAAQMEQRIAQRGEYGQETFVCPLPLYHIYAFTVNMLSMFSMGIANVLIPNPKDVDGFVDTLKKVPFTGLAGINTLFVGLCQHPGFKALDFSGLKITFSGGAALTSEAANLWQQITGCTVTEGWGLTETSPVVTLNQFGREDIGTVGQPLENTQVQAWNENNQPVAQGEVGELVVKGPQVMKGYWNRPDETDKVLVNGWFKTGDMGLIQTNGNIKIVDRLKDMIIVSGFNVFPNEVEEVLCQHPEVLEAAVVGKADNKTGESVNAYVTVGSDTTAEAIQAFCRERLTNYKVPKVVTIMDELPKSTVGKILRRELRD